MKIRSIAYRAAFVLLCVMVLASCRSSKKGMKEQQRDTVQPTVTITTSDEKKETLQEEQQGIAKGANFTSRVRVTVTRGEKTITTNGTLRMRHGEVIQIILVDPLLGVAEVGRLEISPDNILVIDRINRRYVSTTYDEFAALKTRNITFSAIQEIFWSEAQKSDALSYTLPAKTPIKLDLKISDRGSNANWTPHTSVSDRYVKTDANQLFNSLLGK